MRRATILVALALTGCAGGDDEGANTTTEAVEATTVPETTTAPTTTAAPVNTIRGSFELFDSEIFGGWDTCSGTGGYDDIGSGMRVTVRSGDGTVLGVGDTRQVRPPDLKSDDEWLSSIAEEAREDAAADRSCVVVFEVPDVPVSDFYSIEVGSRGELTYSHAEMEADEWIVALSIG